MDDLGLLIKNLRKSAGLSQSQLALRHGMSRATISELFSRTGIVKDTAALTISLY